MRPDRPNPAEKTRLATDVFGGFILLLSKAISLLLVDIGRLLDFKISRFLSAVAVVLLLRISTST
jgi:hypothetical protein